MSTSDTVSFGKYEGHATMDLLADEDYCTWLLRQSWFRRDHPRLFRRVLRRRNVQELREDFNTV